VCLIVYIMFVNEARPLLNKIYLYMCKDYYYYYYYYYFYLLLLLLLLLLLYNYSVLLFLHCIIEMSNLNKSIFWVIFSGIMYYCQGIDFLKDLRKT